MLTFLLRWWWPFFLFISPLAWWIGVPTRGHAFQIHMWVLIVALVGGALLEFSAHQKARLSDLIYSGAWFRRNPAVIVALVYAVWVMVAGLFAPDREAALTGNPNYGSDGAVWYFGLLLCFVLVYLRASLDQALSRRATITVMTLGVFMAALAAFEVLSGRGTGIFYTNSVGQADLPMVTFPQKGHLAGLLLLTAGVAFGASRRMRGWAIPITFVVGLTLARAAYLGLVGAGLVSTILVRRRRTVTVLGISIAALLCGFLIGNSRLTQTGSSKSMVRIETLQTRNYMYKAAIGGIIAHPFFGFGGGQFYLHFWRYISTEDMSDFLLKEYGDTYLRRNGQVFEVKGSDGIMHGRFFPDWKTHDQFLEIALMHGLAGLALYLLLLLLGLRGLLARSPHALGLLAIHIFFLLWFSIPEIEGVLFAVWALAAAEGSKANRPEFKSVDG